MKEADKAITRLNRRRETLEADLAAKASTAAHTELTELGSQLGAVNAELAAAEESWLALAEEAEAGGTKP